MILMVSCNFGEALQDALEKAVWSYSDKGEAEINLNYQALLSDTYKGTFQWNITVNEAETDTSYSLKYYADKSGETKKEKYVCEKDGVTLTRIIIDDVHYYINETAKTVSTTLTQEFNTNATSILYAIKFGIVDLEDDESQPLWTFLSKAESKTVTNSAGTEEDTVEYQYTSVEDTYSTMSTHMYVNFRKIITPVIVRLYYELYSNDVLSKTVTVYPSYNIEEEVDDTTFTIPTAEDGYTVS